jgi:competence protein ComEC
MAAIANELDARRQKWHYEPLVLLTAAMAAGIFLDRQWPLSILLWWLVGIGCLSAWLVLSWVRWDVFASSLVLLAFAATGAAWHHACWHLVPEDHVVRRIREVAQPICLEAYVLSSPRIVPAPPPTPLRAIPTGDRSRCEVEITAVRDDVAWQSASGRARLLTDGHVLGVHAGDVIRVHVLYQRPIPALNPGEFDYALFERSDRRWCNLTAESPDCLSVVRKANWWDGRHWLDRLRLNGDFQLRRHLSPARAALASAVMLGEREYLDADRNERFLVTGTVHLLAISGLNLGILVYIFWILGRTGLLSRRGTLAAAIAFAVIYALLTDAEPPVLRAAALITVFCVARWSGRPVSAWNVLAGAALVVLAWNPTWLFHVGAQLSFLAVAVLAWFQPSLSIGRPADPLDRLILESRSRAYRALRWSLLFTWQVVVSGTLVWLFTFPLVWRYYNLISPVGLALNPLVWLPMSVALFSGFGVLVLSWLSPTLGAISGGICDGSLWLMESVITWGVPLRHGYHWLPAPPIWWIALFYVVLGAALALPALRPRRTWAVALLLAWSAIAFYLAMPVRGANSDKPLDVTFAAVGHGAAILVELPDGRTILYDAGRLGSPLSGARPIAALLWSRGITHLDAVIVSHADSDHYNALPELLERFSVGGVYVSSVMWNEPTPGVVKLREALDARQIPITELLAGDRLRVGEESRTTLEVLHPPFGGVFGNDNANSIVLKIDHAGRRVLLTGDLEARGLADLLAEPALDCDVLMVPHHGSTRSNPRGLVDWCRPEYVVISGTRDFELGRDADAVAREFYQAGSSVLHTALHGAVRFELAADGIRVAPQRMPPERQEDSVYMLAEQNLK